MNSKQRRQRARQIIRDYPYSLADSYERREWCWNNLTRRKDYLTFGDSFTYSMSDKVRELSDTPAYDCIRFKNEADALMCKLATDEPSILYYRPSIADETAKEIARKIDEDLLKVLTASQKNV